jgi:prephenate dehydratase
VTKVAFQGEIGAFSEDAAIKFFGVIEPLPSRSFADAFEAVSRDAASFGVVPIENSQAGSINDTYDLLLKYDLNICGEIVLPVNQCLMAPEGESLETIRYVYSHPQALTQCEEYLRKLNTTIVPTYDTAGSAKLVKEKGLQHSAAVASRRAAQIYGLKLLAENIQTNPNNYTKFVVVSRERADRAADSKTSIVFATKNMPGTLYASLGAFATRGINLTKLESRPSRQKPWEYVFYADFEGHVEDKPCLAALESLRGTTKFIKILGSYPRAAES